MKSRRFRLVREHDISGISGTGPVADGLLLPGGWVVLTWRSQWPTVTLHLRGLDSVRHIHGHGGLTRIEWKHPRFG